ncbi:uncharacterized protein FOMMEDRAFT_131165 [Fomitiporia mediterranea MF3/22]|uniref:uncharacterized protein n=1 Tax=Fomitiporia mediterranea (strain MF3/22) TaxID=694068 RepID=UPI0004407FDB|nr:uncharacterized protein FOMMEDRAFT_131165 [Fomitiporia mediterranea MF3/22]EJD08350.1 hypothetical protein FOMMEDRAFT_131165 [Fomitiporia mediterranea MF3/22]
MRLLAVITIFHLVLCSTAAPLYNHDISSLEYHKRDTEPLSSASKRDAEPLSDTFRRDAEPLSDTFKRDAEPLSDTFKRDVESLSITFRRSAQPDEDVIYHNLDTISNAS